MSALAAISGRWTVEGKGDESDTLAVVSSVGEVTFLGEPDSGLRFATVEDVDGLVLLHEGMQVAKGQLEEPEAGRQVLRVTCPDGACETWHRLRNLENDPAPHVTRKRNSIQRRLTKEAAHESEDRAEERRDKIEEPQCINGSTVLPPSPATVAAQVKRCFARVNEDSEGRIDISFLNGFLTRCGGNLSEQEVEDLFKAMDKDQSGKVNFNTFVDFVMR